MSDFYGVPGSFSDKLMTFHTFGWFMVGDQTGDGYSSGSGDGYGPNTNWTSPGGIVKSIVRTGVGAYTLTLSQPPLYLYWFKAESVLTYSSPALGLGCQIVGFNVGLSSAGANPTIQFVFHRSGVPTEVPDGSGFLFDLVVGQS